MPKLPTKKTEETRERVTLTYVGLYQVAGNKWSHGYCEGATAIALSPDRLYGRCLHKGLKPGGVITIDQDSEGSVYPTSSTFERYLEDPQLTRIRVAAEARETERAAFLKFKKEGKTNYDDVTVGELRAQYKALRATKARAALLANLIEAVTKR